MKDTLPHHLLGGVGGFFYYYFAVFFSLYPHIRLNYLSTPDMRLFIMEKLADISAFTNLMNQNNSMPVYNGFKDKAKTALISALVGGALAGSTGYHRGRDVGYNRGNEQGYEQGYDRGFIDADSGQTLHRTQRYYKPLHEVLEELKFLCEPRGYASIYEAKPDYHNKRVRTLLHLLDRYENSLTEEDKRVYSELRMKLQGSGLLDAYDFNGTKNGTGLDLDLPESYKEWIRSNPWYTPQRR